MNEVPHSYLYHKIKVTENCSVRIDLRAPQGSVVFECIPFFHTILEPLLFASGVKSPTLFRQVHTMRGVVSFCSAPRSIKVLAVIWI